MPATERIWVSRMREIRTSGLKRAEVARSHGLRILSHARGNPDTDVSRSLNDPVASATRPAVSRRCRVGAPCGAGVAVGQRQAVDQRDADHSPPRTCGINAICTSSTGSLSGRLDDIPDQNAQRLRLGSAANTAAGTAACWACNCAWYCIAGRPATAPGTALAGPASAPGTAAAALWTLCCSWYSFCWFW